MRKRIITLLDPAPALVAELFSSLMAPGVTSKIRGLVAAEETPCVLICPKEMQRLEREILRMICPPTKTPSFLDQKLKGTGVTGHRVQDLQELLFLDNRSHESLLFTSSPLRSSKISLEAPFAENGGISFGTVVRTLSQTVIAHWTQGEPLPKIQVKSEKVVAGDRIGHSSTLGDEALDELLDTYFTRGKGGPLDLFVMAGLHAVREAQALMHTEGVSSAARLLKEVVQKLQGAAEVSGHEVEAETIVATLWAEFLSYKKVFQRMEQKELLEVST